MIKFFKTLRWPTGEAYLRRWMLTPEIGGWKWPFRLYLHNIVRPDAGRDPHDHPSWFLTVVLRGEYIERVYDERGDYLRDESRRAGDVIYRPATYVHRISWVEPVNGAWTLSIWGRRSKQWGFYPMPGVFVAEDLYPRTAEQLRE